MFVDIPGKIFYKILKEHPETFPDWRDEGTRFWNSRTGEILEEDGTVMFDLVWRQDRDYDNYWKDCFNDGPKSFTWTGEIPKMTFTVNTNVGFNSYEAESIKVTRSFPGEVYEGLTL